MVLRTLTSLVALVALCLLAVAPAPAAAQAPREYGDPAFARGYDDGYDYGLNDGRRRERYDPARSQEYRDGDAGYQPSYGSREAYRNNYRAGFRRGYEDGYRDGTR